MLERRQERADGAPGGVVELRRERDRRHQAGDAARQLGPGRHRRLGSVRRLVGEHARVGQRQRGDLIDAHERHGRRARLAPGVEQDGARVDGHELAPDQLPADQAELDVGARAAVRDERAGDPRELVEDDPRRARHQIVQHAIVDRRAHDRPAFARRWRSTS